MKRLERWRIFIPSQNYETYMRSENDACSAIANTFGTKPTWVRVYVSDADKEDRKICENCVCWQPADMPGRVTQLCTLWEILTKPGFSCQSFENKEGKE